LFFLYIFKVIVKLICTPEIKFSGFVPDSIAIWTVRMLREELQLLQEPGSYVGEVVKVMGKNKVLVKVSSLFILISSWSTAPWWLNFVSFRYLHCYISVYHYHLLTIVK